MNPTKHLSASVCSVLLVTVMLAGFSVNSYAQVYKWKDAQGNMHYSDTPPMDVKNVESKNVKANVVDTDAQPFETKVAAQKYPVSVYSFDGCGDVCVTAQAYLDKRGIPYMLKNSEADKTALQKLTGSMQIPVLVVGNKTPRRGFEEATWAALLDEAGYPKNNPLANVRKPVNKSAPAAQPDSTATPTPTN